MASSAEVLKQASAIAGVGIQPPESWKRVYAKLIADFYRHEIGVLMHQAEHWRVRGKPLAVHHRLHKADSYYQIVVLFEAFASCKSDDDPFLRMRAEIDRAPIYPPGEYPPSAELNRYRDPAFVVQQLAKPEVG